MHIQSLVTTFILYFFYRRMSDKQRVSGGDGDRLGAWVPEHAAAGLHELRTDH